MLPQYLLSYLLLLLYLYLLLSLYLSKLLFRVFRQPYGLPALIPVALRAKMDQQGALACKVSFHCYCYDYYYSY